VLCINYWSVNVWRERWSVSI